MADMNVIYCETSIIFKLTNTTAHNNILYSVLSYLLNIVFIKILFEYLLPIVHRQLKYF